MFSVTICECGNKTKNNRMNSSLLLKTVESNFMELDLMTNSSEELRISLMLSAAYVLSTAGLRGEANALIHTHTHSCRLHNTRGLLVNIIDLHRILVLPRGLHGRRLILLCPPVFICPSNPSLKSHSPKILILQTTYKPNS